jgi:SAM-dependent methyltransferase
MVDVFGRMVRSYYRDELVDQPVVRRDDGHTRPAHCAWYFADQENWGVLDREGIARCRGTVLDVGCGVGRALLWLAEQAHEAVGVDASRRAVEVARDRGATAVVGEMNQLPIAPEAVDTVLFVGTHFGAVETQAGVRELLAALDGVLRPGGRIVADLYDPTRIEDDDLRSYLADRWQAPGVATRRFRLEYDGEAGPWRTLLQCTPEALAGIVEPSGWECSSILPGDGTRYYVVLERRTAAD